MPVYALVFIAHRQVETVGPLVMRHDGQVEAADIVFLRDALYFLHEALADTLAVVRG